MITFEDVRVEDHETYTIIPMCLAADFSWFLDKNGIKHSKISYGMFIKGKKPEITKLFTLEGMKQSLFVFKEIGEDDSLPCILITNLNSEDLIKKVIMMAKEPEDKDLKEYKRQVQQRLEKELQSDKELRGINIWHK